MTVQIYIVDTTSSKSGKIIVYYGKKLGRPPKNKNTLTQEEYNKRKKHYKNSYKKKENPMTGEEIKATKLTKLVQRLFVIDATLTKDNSQLVTEYNEIIEEIWTILEGIELKTDPPKVLSLTKNGGNVNGN